MDTVDVTADIEKFRQYATTFRRFRQPAVELRRRLDDLSALIATESSMDGLEAAFASVETLTALVEAAIRLADMGDAMAADLSAAAAPSPLMH